MENKVEGFEYIMSEDSVQSSLQQLGSLKKKVMETEQEKLANQQEIEKLQKMVEAYKMENANKSDQIESLIRDFVDKQTLFENKQVQSEQKSEQLKQQLSSITQQDNNYYQKLNEALEHIQKLKTQLQKTTQKLLDMTTDLNAKNQKIEKMMQHQNRLQKDLEASHDELNNQKKKFVQIEEKYLELQSKTKQLLIEQEGLESNKKQLEKIIEAKNLEVLSLQETIQNLKCKLKDCVTQLERNKVEFSRYEQVQYELQRSREKLFVENGLLKKDCQELMKDKEYEFLKSQKHEMIIKQHENKILKLKSENQKLAAQLNKISGSSANNSNNNIGSNNNSFSLEQNEQQQQDSNLQCENEQLKKIMQNMQQEIEEKNKRLEKYQQFLPYEKIQHLNLDTDSKNSATPQIQNNRENKKYHSLQNDHQTLNIPQNYESDHLDSKTKQMMENQQERSHKLLLTIRDNDYKLKKLDDQNQKLQQCDIIGYQQIKSTLEDSSFQRIEF